MPPPTTFVPVLIPLRSSTLLLPRRPCHFMVVDFYVGFQIAKDTKSLLKKI